MPNQTTLVALDFKIPAVTQCQASGIIYTFETIR
jgi:hypothetical protein